MPSTTFAPFRSRAFLLVWLGAMVSNIGTWMETTALSFYVADHAAASWSGVVAAAGFLPTAFLSPIGGAWADRFRRRNVLIWANLASAVIAGTIALIVATGDATPGILAMMALAAGCSNALGFPSFQATLPDLVPKDQLVAAIGLSSTQWNLGRILGPTAAGVAIWIGGVPAALWCNTASFFAVILAVTLARIPDMTRTKRPIFQAMRDSIAFGRSNAAVRSMLPLMFMIALIGAPFIGFIAQMATKVFHTQQSGTSLLVTAQGVGAVIAGASIGSLTHRFGMRRTMLGAVTFFGPAIILYGLAPNIVFAAIGVALAGGGYMACISSFSSITQQSAPAELRGRALTLNNFVLGFAYPLGLFIEGPLADATSLRAVTIGSGALTIGILAVGRLLKPRHTEPIGLALS
ncbi:MAG: arabinose efflux permease family protein [Ilumatobacteraceae bacterium]|nr:arabinose efflux permease family protein [Ilumatobacteraceae bacterium]